MTLPTLRASLCGISGVHVTPYDPDGDIDEKLLRQIVSRITEAGVHNIVSGGNTGEFFSLTFDEVVRLQAVAFDAIADRATKIAGVGRSLQEALATGRLAAGAGADALMVHHPSDPFSAPSSQADYFIAIADGSNIPVVAYLRADTIPINHLVRVATHPNVAGVKFASPNLVLLGECLRATEGHSTRWICGLAEGWAPAFYAQGTRGFTSGLVNLDPHRSIAIWKALESGQFDVARELIAAIARFEGLRTKFNNGANVTVVKEALTIAGMAVGPVRLPGLQRLDKADRDELVLLLTRLRRAD